jgi:outer membrane protein OmpA-like peptidoglycan-associated protein
MSQSRLHRVPVTLAVAVAAIVVASLSAQQKSGFGSKDPGLFNMKGTIYFLPDDTTAMPQDLSKLKPQGVIYADRLDVPPRDFQEGFPGVTDRFEWFGILYTGTFYIEKPGEYGWRVLSDDGALVWIDGEEVLNNDGIHPAKEMDGTTKLTRGSHAIKVWYHQGPATEVALQLFITPPGGEEKIFAMTDYAPGAGKVTAQPTPEGIRVRLDSAILFDTAKYNLKPAAREAIQAVSELIAAYPNATVRVLGYTDSVGEDAYNLKLSEDRAASVKNALVALGPPKGVVFETQGFGEADPVASNDNESGRALNRRVEVLIKPSTAR